MVVADNLLDFVAVAVQVLVKTGVGFVSGKRDFRHDMAQCMQRLVLSLVVAALAKGLVGRTKVRRGQVSVALTTARQVYTVFTKPSVLGFHAAVGAYGTRRLRRY